MSEDCPHCVFEKTEANCRGCFEGSHYKPKPITNADRIRAMTDEELARWIATTADDNCPDTAHERYCDNRCGECWLDWLKSQVEVQDG